MRHLAVVLAAALVFALIAPALAQPFADVPTNHWAYDAIAELAAKGLVEGYPDGTFRGDRTVTRFEMAMIVARLLARVESIQIPAPQAPQVTRTDVASIQRLVNEFRAELAALGVRVTAIEEELNAIKAKLDNVRVTGTYMFQYTWERTGTGASLNGNSNTFATDSSTQMLGPAAQSLFRLQFDGSVAPNVHLIAALLSGNGPKRSLPFNSSNFGFNAPGAPNRYVLATVDDLFFDWKNAFGWPIEFWLGRFGGGESGIGGGYPVQFGPFGLLMNTTSSTWSDSTGESNANVADGLAMFGHWASLADLQVQALIVRIIGGLGSTSYFDGEDAYGVDANVQLMPGLRLGGYYVANSINAAGTGPAGTASNPSQFGALWHVYGPAVSGGGVNPVTANCPASTGTFAGVITCPASGSGGGGYLGWTAFPGIHVDGEYALWNDAVHGTSDSGWQVNVAFDVGTLTGVGHNLTADLGYLNFGQNFYPPYGNADSDSAMFDVIYPGNAQGFLGDVSWGPATGWTVYAIYFGGNNVSNGMTLTEYEAGVKYKLAPGAELKLYIRDTRINNIDQDVRYRLQMKYKF